jgi:hypothetical protein
MRKPRRLITLAFMFCTATATITACIPIGPPNGIETIPDRSAFYGAGTDG